MAEQDHHLRVMGAVRLRHVSRYDLDVWISPCCLLEDTSLVSHSPLLQDTNQALVHRYAACCYPLSSMIREPL